MEKDDRYIRSFITCTIAHILDHGKQHNFFSDEHNIPAAWRKSLIKDKGSTVVPTLLWTLRILDVLA